MKRFLFRATAWTLVTGLSIVIANAAVGSVRNQVSDPPRAAAAVAPDSVVTTTSPPATTELSSVAPGTPTSTPTSSTVATMPGEPTSTIASGESGPPSTEASSSSTAPSTTTSSVATSGQIKTVSTAGGTASIEVYPDHIVLLGAVPAAGFSVEEVEQSATKVEIEFKSADSEVHLNAQLSNGELQIEIEVKDRSESDDD